MSVLRLVATSEVEIDALRPVSEPQVNHRPQLHMPPVAFRGSTNLPRPVRLQTSCRGGRKVVAEPTENERHTNLPIAIARGGDWTWRRWRSSV